METFVMSRHKIIKLYYISRLAWSADGQSFNGYKINSKFGSNSLLILFCKFLPVARPSDWLSCKLKLSLAVHYADALIRISIICFSIDASPTPVPSLKANEIGKRKKKSWKQFSRAAICMSLTTRKNTEKEKKKNINKQRENSWNEIKKKSQSCLGRELMKVKVFSRVHFMQSEEELHIWWRKNE